MGEVVVIGESRNKNNIADCGAAVATEGTSSSTVMWERFLPKMMVRVLLVESDVSTRQIITALLRKCSYKVAAVSDGLKAWELLKGRPHNIDLILTEVELPSISGYALLSLIMEHDVCKNIPVIMMSSNDSVSTVYKCMLRGAADFLIKPLRKNELRNMWQHVWRKQVQSSSGAGLGPPDESETQQNVEAMAENNVVSNRSRECIEKRSDAHSSCSKPNGENGGTATEHVRCLSQPNNTKCLSNDVNIRAQESKTPIAQDDESDVRRDANCAVIRGEENNFEGGLEQVNVNGKQSEINRVLDPSREAIDFIGTFDNYLKGTFRSSTSNASTNKLDIFPTLDLSLRKSLPSGSVNLINDERHPLNHSDVSAFSRYINKPLQVSNASLPSTSNHQKDYETNSKKKNSNHTPDSNSDTHCPASSLHKYVSVNTIQPAPCEITYMYRQQREISLPTPVRGIRFENMINNSYGIGSIISPIYPIQSVELQDSSYQQCHNLTDQRVSNDVDHQVDNKEKLEHNEHVSPGNDQSGNISLCTGNISYQIIGLGSVVKVTSECGNEEAREGFSNRSMQREAALTKFRLKRKDRCFDKKVRYESRKKLAEQRPRVKGQFVRQVTNDPQSGNSSAS